METKILEQKELRSPNLYYNPYPRPVHITYLDNGLYVAKIVHGEAS